MQVKPLDTFSTAISAFGDEIQKEKAKANVNHSKIAILLLAQSSILQLNCYNTFREQSYKMREQIAKLMQKVDESYSDPTTKHLQKSFGAGKIISGVLSGIGSAIGGFVSDTTPKLKMVQGVFQGGGGLIGGIGGGVESFKDIEQNKQKALQEQLSHLREEAKKTDEEVSRDAESAERKRIKDEDCIKEIENAQSSAFRAVAG